MQSAEVALIVWTLRLGGHWFMTASFEFGRAQVTESRVPPLANVKALDVIRRLHCGPELGVPLTVVGQLEFESGENALRRCVSRQFPLRLMPPRIR